VRACTCSRACDTGTAATTETANWETKRLQRGKELRVFHNVGQRKVDVGDVVLCILDHLQQRTVWHRAVSSSACEEQRPHLCKRESACARAMGVFLFTFTYVQIDAQRAHETSIPFSLHPLVIPCTHAHTHTHTHTCSRAASGPLHTKDSSKPSSSIVSAPQCHSSGKSIQQTDVSVHDGSMRTHAQCQSVRAHGHVRMRPRARERERERALFYPCGRESFGLWPRCRRHASGSRGLWVHVCACVVFLSVACFGHEQRVQQV
jgi:hypothetical protein